MCALFVSQTILLPPNFLVKNVIATIYNIKLLSLPNRDYKDELDSIIVHRTAYSARFTAHYLRPCLLGSPRRENKV